MTSLLEQFAAGVSARTAAELVGINRNTAILYFHIRDSGLKVQGDKANPMQKLKRLAYNCPIYHHMTRL
jgi:transposase-like protein